jgi:hypothetical protein
VRTGEDLPQAQRIHHGGGDGARRQRRGSRPGTERSAGSGADERCSRPVHRARRPRHRTRHRRERGPARFPAGNSSACSGRRAWISRVHPSTSARRAGAGPGADSRGHRKAALDLDAAPVRRRRNGLADSQPHKPDCYRNVPLCDGSLSDARGLLGPMYGRATTVHFGAGSLPAIDSLTVATEPPGDRAQPSPTCCGRGQQPYILGRVRRPVRPIVPRFRLGTSARPGRTQASVAAAAQMATPIHSTSV